MKLELALTRIDGRRRHRILSERLDAGLCACSDIIRAARLLASAYRESEKHRCRCNRPQRAD